MYTYFLILPPIAHAYANRDISTYMLMHEEGSENGLLCFLNRKMRLFYSALIFNLYYMIHSIVNDKYYFF